MCIRAHNTHNRIAAHSEGKLHIVSDCFINSVNQLPKRIKQQIKHMGRIKYKGAKRIQIRLLFLAFLVTSNSCIDIHTNIKQHGGGIPTPNRQSNKNTMNTNEVMDSNFDTYNTSKRYANAGIHMHGDGKKCDLPVLAQTRATRATGSRRSADQNHTIHDRCELPAAVHGFPGAQIDKRMPPEGFPLSHNNNPLNGIRIGQAKVPGPCNKNTHLLDNKRARSPSPNIGMVGDDLPDLANSEMAEGMSMCPRTCIHENNLSSPRCSQIHLNKYVHPEINESHENIDDGNALINELRSKYPNRFIAELSNCTHLLHWVCSVIGHSMHSLLPSIVPVGILETSSNQYLAKLVKATSPSSTQKKNITQGALEQSLKVMPTLYNPSSSIRPFSPSGTKEGLGCMLMKSPLDVFACFM